MNSSNQSQSGMSAEEWRRRGTQDAQDARFDPPANPDDRAAYESGYFQARELTP